MHPSRRRATEGVELRHRVSPRGARQSALAALLALVVVGATGCFAALLVGTGAAVGGGTIAYQRGELSTALEAPIADVWTAAQETVESLEFDVTQRRKDAVYATLVAVTASDKRVHINLERAAERVTSVRIRVGWFGDEALSKLILDKIQERI